MEGTTQDLHATLQTYIRDNLLGGNREIAFEDQLLMDGILDSMSIVRLVNFLDESLGVTVPPQELTIENFGTINDLVVYLNR